MSATFGRNLRMTIFGESHGKGIGLVLDGLPPGTPIEEEFIKEEMARRAPGKNQMSTQRQEKDAFIIESGVFEGKATGTPLCVLIPNSDQHSKDYSLLKDVMRPGHADYAGKVRYKGFNDYRGGGHFSGRLTAPLVFTGAVAKTVLAQKGIIVGAHVARIGKITDVLFNPLGETAERLQALRKFTLPVLDDGKASLMEAEIMAPIPKEVLKSELTDDKRLRMTSKSNNEVYVITWQDSPNVVREIGRLREIAFRAAGGGTGLDCDLDEFDTMENPYKQLIVWNPESEEIIGGYRYILGPDIKLDEKGQPILATSHMFHFSDEF
ncbi:MAG: chorismate synthase, partial [Succiniclasticum sp.]|nr:chorismate synthase [Succiniclasticum sp.]